MTLRPIKNKRDFVERYIRGEFGNGSPTWSTWEEFEADEEHSLPLLEDEGQLWHIRNRNPGPTWYNIDAENLPDKWDYVVKHIGAENIYLSAMVPTRVECTLKIQGEIRVTNNSLDAVVSTVVKPMRQALAEESRALTGLQCGYTLWSLLNEYSFDHLMQLLQDYPDHIIEFSTYGVDWGSVPGHNTLFWEVRPDRGFGHSLSEHTEVY